MIGRPGPDLARSLRLLVGVVGGYAFAAGVVAIIGAAAVAGGMARSESATLGAMLGLLVYPAIIIWAAASSRPLRTAGWVGAGAVTMLLGAPLLVPG